MKVLVIGDLHCPYEHPEYLSFAQHVYKMYHPQQVIFIGDIADEHSISYKYPMEDDAYPASEEYQRAYEHIQQWYTAFPKAWICIGNHDERPLKTARIYHIPVRRLKLFGELWQTPRWKWDYKYVIDSILFTHSIGGGGNQPAVNASKRLGCSVVMGHWHNKASITYTQTYTRRIVSIDVGCGIDATAPVFRYATGNIVSTSVLSVACIDTQTLRAELVCMPELRNK